MRHANCSLAHFGGKLDSCLVHDDSIISNNGASSKPGAIHAKLDQKFNVRQFGADSVKNQTGNLLALGAGLLAPRIAVFIVPALAGAGAPLIIIGFLGAIAVGVAYKYFGADESLAKKAKTFFGVE